MTAPTDTSATGACRSTLTGEPMPAEEAERLAGIFKAVADPARLQLLSIIASQEGGEACVCHLTEPLGLSQPTISHHLKILMTAGLLTRDQRGKWAYYAVIPHALDTLGGVLTTRHVVSSGCC